MSQRLRWSVIATAAFLSLGCTRDVAGPRSFSSSGAALRASSTGPTFTTIDFPGGSANIAADINKTGQIAGRYVDAASIMHGYLYSGGSFASILFPGAVYTRSIGINNAGDIVGDYSLIDTRGDKGEHGYLLHNASFSSIDVPGAANTVAEGIDSYGDIVGFYTTNDGTNTNSSGNNRHGFLLSGGVFTSIDFPGSSGTETWKINDRGQILGKYRSTTDTKWHLYLLQGGTFTPIPDFPGADQVAPDGWAHVGGLNTQGDIVSTYCLSACQNVGGSGPVFGFLLSGGSYTTISVPNSVLTIAFGISSTGAIVGTYEDALGIHGFVRTP